MYDDVVINAKTYGEVTEDFPNGYIKNQLQAHSFSL